MRLPMTAEFPEAGIGFTEGLVAAAREKPQEFLPAFTPQMEEAFVAVEHAEGEQHLAIDIVLNVFRRLIATAHRL